jgi:formylglycine-generating enzyme required for sulfatase activity
VSCYDALVYCHWLSEATGRTIALPSEAQWEKAARGANSARIAFWLDYPWGDRFDVAKCNTEESGFGGTTPVGIFAQGASPYGCLNMAGNVREWTRSLWGTDLFNPEFDYPYDPADAARENLKAASEVHRVVRGGSWYLTRDHARCAARLRFLPDFPKPDLGFRVILLSDTVP